MNDKFTKLKEELKETQNQISQLRGKEFKLNKKYIELLQENCKKNIGRCFKKFQDDKVIRYCIIVDTDKLRLSRIIGYDFNEFQYPAIWLNVTDEKTMPFYIDNIHSNAWSECDDYLYKINHIRYEEITKEEFMEKFNEVNNQWINSIQNINKN